MRELRIWVRDEREVRIDVQFVSDATFGMRRRWSCRREGDSGAASSSLPPLTD